MNSLTEILKIIDLALRAAAEFAAAGKDPYAEIKRLLEADEYLKNVGAEQEWKAHLDRLWPSK